MTHAELIAELEILRVSKAWHRTLVNESSDPMFSYFPDGSYRYVNHAFAEGVGRKLEDIVGKTIWDLFPKEEADTRFAVVKWVFDNGESRVMEARVPRPDGDRYYLTTVKPILDDQRRVTSVICNSKDITDRKQLEESLEESREKYRALSEAAFEAVFISEKGKCLEQNTRAEEIFGWTTEEALGRFGTDWIVPKDRDRVMQNMLTGYELPYEVSGLRKDGSTFPAVIRGKMMNYKGRLVRVTSMEDITERKKAVDSLRASEERYRVAFRTSMDAIAINRSADGFYLEVNQGFERSTGWQRDEVIGKTSLELGIWADPADRQHMLEGLSHDGF